MGNKNGRQRADSSGSFRIHAHVGKSNHHPEAGRGADDAERQEESTGEKSPAPKARNDEE